MNPATPTYTDALSLARQLDLSEQLRLLEALAAMVRQRLPAQSRRSILELRGLGKEIWQGVDVQAYIPQERAS